MSDINTNMIKECPVDGIMFDIGAHVGSYTTIMAEKAKKVYAFEPSPDNVTKLRRNVAEFGNVIIFQLALSNCCGTGRLMLHPNNPGGHSIHKELIGRQWHHTLEDSVQVEVITLDLWCQHNGITRVDGIKIDVEAHEQHVLEGARNTLKKYHPLISLETHQGSDPKAVQKVLEECGYDVPDLVADKAYLLRKKGLTTNLS